MFTTCWAIKVSFYHKYRWLSASLWIPPIVYLTHSVNYWIIKILISGLLLLLLSLDYFIDGQKQQKKTDYMN